MFSTFPFWIFLNWAKYTYGRLPLEDIAKFLKFFKKKFQKRKKKKKKNLLVENVKVAPLIKLQLS